MERNPNHPRIVTMGQWKSQGDEKRTGNLEVTARQRDIIAALGNSDSAVAVARLSNYAINRPITQQ